MSFNVRNKYLYNQTWIKIYRRNNLVYKGNFLNCFYLITVPHPFKISVYLIAVHIQ